MPITIVTDAGAANANSYVDEVTFIAYLATRLNIPAGSTVTGSACTETEKAALIEATRDLTVPRYKGERGTGTQALAWPRIWAPNPDAPTTLVDPESFIPIGTAQIAYYAADEIPDRVKDATCELALQYLKAGTTDLAALDATLAVTRKVVGPIETDYAPAAERAQGLGRFPRVLNRIAPLLADASSGGLRMVRC